jgi:hypothetical protein
MLLISIFYGLSFESIYLELETPFQVLGFYLGILIPFLMLRRRVVDVLMDLNFTVVLRILFIPMVLLIWVSMETDLLRVIIDKVLAISEKD